LVDPGCDPGGWFLESVRHAGGEFGRVAAGQGGLNRSDLVGRFCRPASPINVGRGDSDRRADDDGMQRSGGNGFDLFAASPAQRRSSGQKKRNVAADFRGELG